MKITDLLSLDSIALHVDVKDKDDAIQTLVNLMDHHGNLINTETYKKGIYEREALSSTGIGYGVAIPHAQSASVKAPGLAAMVVDNGVDYESIDGTLANLFFMIAVPETGGNEHLQILAMLSTLLMDEDFRVSLTNAKTNKEFMKLIDEKEKEKEAQQKQEDAKNGYRLLAVTSCPTGIAHTYMAAESIEKKAKEMGISIKVETDGSGGAKNVLTKQEIEQCEAIIVAADAHVEMARFHGKPVIQAQVATGIHNPEKLIQDALSKNAPIYTSDRKQEVVSEHKESIGHTIYKHLMSGVSHMLPFVVGGGIMIAIAFMLDDFNIDPSNFGMNTPLAAFFKTTGGAAFGFMLPVLAGYIAMSIADRPGLAVGFVGGYLANAGGSGFLGALLMGFIAGYLVKYMAKLCDKLPEALEGIKPVLIYPFVGILLVGFITTFVVNPPVSFLNESLTNVLTSMGSSSKVLLGLVLASMMAIDMGGPINKAAYVFGTASIISGNYDIMAAVMIGGMVPPLAIALCTTFFKNRFTKSERQSGITNYIMGLSFITEGAIPFAASDPIHVIPACALGSAVAGALSMFFNCTLMAPHGGIFVLSVIGNPLGYFASLVIGAILGMFLLAILKKPIKS